ncbi:hypothetical protein MKK58_09375 [Methylobacterium sp. J-078]|uniref:hypothetical protein n=1 Tax=Methylobacterium sp. J-078 TaxID=2836657 RepID=UPI001FB95915|nr:hypothetical protein [Methylobacterium sp. J-078]MCJ2044736.1 hypothetical protein [Methylobacterium sp. J-078]
MAEYANSTPVPASVRPQQVGPVTQAIWNIRGPHLDPIEAIRAGLENYFAGLGIVLDFDAPIPIAEDIGISVVGGLTA